MTNGEKFMEVFGVGCATYDVMHDITTIHRNGDWWDAEYEGEEKITDKITDHEALEILEEVMEMDDSMYQYNQRYLEALNMALDALKFKKKAGVVIEQLRADRDRLATALEEIEAKVKTMCDNAQIQYIQENGRDEYSYGRKQVYGIVHDDLTEIMDSISEYRKVEE